MKRKSTRQRNHADKTESNGIAGDRSPSTSTSHLRMLEGVHRFCPRISFKRTTRQGLVGTEAMFPIICCRRGRFRRLEGMVTQVMPAKERVRILMEFLGRKVEAEVGHASVLLDVAHPLAA